MAWGAVYDFVTSLGKIIRLSAAVFLLDFLMMVFFALSFFSLLIGYNSGQIRVLLLAATAAAMTAYMLTVHRAFAQLFDKSIKFFRRKVKKLAKALKKCKKF